MTAGPSTVVIRAKAGIQLWTAFLSATLLGAISQARADNILARPVPPVLIKQVGCMVKSLQATSKIDHVKSEVARIGGMPRAFVQYRDNSKAGKGATLRFSTQGLEPPFQFFAPFSGLTAPGHLPELYGSPAVIKAWSDRCGVSAGAFFP